MKILNLLHTALRLDGAGMEMVPSNREHQTTSGTVLALSLCWCKVDGTVEEEQWQGGGHSLLTFSASQYKSQTFLLSRIIQVPVAIDWRLPSVFLFYFYYQVLQSWPYICFLRPEKQRSFSRDKWKFKH